MKLFFLARRFLRIATLVLRPASCVVRRAVGVRTLVVAAMPVVGLMAEDDRGAPSVLRGLFGIGLLILGPLVGGIFFAFVQLGLYRLLAKMGAIKKEHIPIFPVFVLRGMIIMIAIVAGVLFWLKLSGNAIPDTFGG